MYKHPHAPHEDVSVGKGEDEGVGGLIHARFLFPGLHPLAALIARHRPHQPHHPHRHLHFSRK